MKAKLTKEEKRHLDDARRDKQVKEHAVQQVQELPGMFSLSTTQARLVPTSPSFEVILPSSPLHSIRLGIADKE